MKIVIVSDTHMPRNGRGLPDRLQQDLTECDLIIHGGDFQTLDVYKEFVGYGELIAVAGNVDSAELQSLLPKKRIVQKNGLKIGVVHGDGKGKTTEKRALEAFEEDEVDVIIFGHSHIPFSRFMKGVLLFNPGSPTDKRKLPYFSHGILTIEDTWKVEHTFYH
ncbi:YfcE family phosphodiesterase [Bacillus sp. AFS015802]|uniref:metallophosphoesterase family protein n=1 Tax=Bacillus sp. AFS015802 TaxID=2033486 RepID=UPI000BF322BB|nr:metallophosphoesterase [Bacillus sp. AFS015802]PFA70745.1 YfcE family phosphodiesterase [Bacillus sp. AFS015802]